MFPFDYSKRTTIGNDVWIGDCALVKAGVTIGDGAVIGMGSVVTKDIPPYEIWAGNPARRIKVRFDPDTVARMLATKWWDLDDAAIEKKAKSMNDPKKFLESFDSESGG
jgi:serine acetyltransferase